MAVSSPRRADGHAFVIGSWQRTGYHAAVVEHNTAEPTFDPVWLARLAEVAGSCDRSSPRLEDLYLERRLEVAVSAGDAGRRRCEVRTEGASARWRFPTRTAIHARTGVSPMTVASLLQRYGATTDIANSRPMPTAELDPPRGWCEKALDMVATAQHVSVEIRYLRRTAAVIRPESVSLVAAPPLVRIRVDSPAPAAALVVWNDPHLDPLIHDLLRPAPTRTWAPDPGTILPVVFADGSAGILLHEIVGHLCESDLVVSGLSPLAPLHLATVTTPEFHLADDPLDIDLPGAFDCDDEGVTARSIELIDGGRLCGWLCDRDGSRRTGHPAGRGRRPIWSRSPVPRMSNLVVAPGSTEPQDLEHGLTQGVVVTRLAGAAVDPTSGRVALRVAEGWEIRHGRRRRPLAPFELVGSVLEVLSRIDGRIGHDPTPDRRLGWCVKDGFPLPTGSRVPTLLIHGLGVM